MHDNVATVTLKRHPNRIPGGSVFRKLISLSLFMSLAFTAQVFAHGTVTAPDKAVSEREIVFPDTAEHKTLVVDLHTHSVFSDGHVWPRIRVEEALRDGLDAMAVTEHLEYQPHLADIPHGDRNRSVEIALAAAEGSDLIIIKGSEITRGDPAGHINAIFITDANKLFNVPNPPADASDVLGYYKAADAWPAQDAVDAASAQDAFIFWNHPYWNIGKPDAIARITKFQKDNIKANKLHGIEIANGQDYSAEAHAIALKYDLAMMGVSDIHDLVDWDYKPHEGGHRPVNLVLAKEKSTAGIREALFAKRTLVWFRNLLIARKPEMDAMLAASMHVTNVAYRDRSQVLDVTITNTSDASFNLLNLGKITFMDHADRITIAANTSTTFSVKPGKYVTALELKFSVENALLAPKKHPTISFTLAPEVPKIP